MASLPAEATDRHRMLLEQVETKQAKAILKDRELGDVAPLIGRAIERAIAGVGWTKKEAAAVVGVEPAQISRWIAGTERPQFDRLFGVVALRKPLVISLGTELAGAEHDERLSFPRGA